PHLARVGFLRSANNPSTVPTVFFPAPGPLGMRLVTVEIHDAAGLDRAFDTLTDAKVQALTSDGDPLTDAQSRRIVESAMSLSLHGVSPRLYFAYNGCYMSNAPNIYET